MVSILILTKNEQLDLPGALASVSWSDDVHVLDSHSTDQTQSIALAAGAHLHTRSFDDYATHRNFGFTLPFRYPWLLILDADERPTPQLSAEIQQLVPTLDPTNPTTPAGFRLRRRDFFFNTWLKNSQISPFYIRLVQPSRSRYTRAINEVLEVDGAVGDLTQPLDHFPFSKGIAHWVAKHNVYSTMEAQLIHARTGLTNPSLRTALTDPDFHTRRLHQKALFYRLPGRPLIKWAYMMFLRRGVLDGPAGWAYATLQAIYEYLIVLKTKELAQSVEKD